MIMIWRKHKSFGDYLPPTHESYPYVIRRENRDRIILEVNPGPIKLGQYDSVGAAKTAATNHNKKRESR